MCVSIITELPGHAAHAFERQQGMPQVIEDSQEQDQVKRPDPFGRELHHIDLHVFHLGAQRGAREIKARFAGHGVIENVVSPDVAVGGQHAGRAAALGFEGHVAVPRADIEHRHSAEVGRHADAVEQRARIVGAGRHDAVAQIDGVPPLDLIYFCAQTVRAALAERLLNDCAQRTVDMAFAEGLLQHFDRGQRLAALGQNDAEVGRRLSVLRIAFQGESKSILRLHETAPGELRRGPVIPDFARLLLFQRFAEQADGLVEAALLITAEALLMFLHGQHVFCP